MKGILSSGNGGHRVGPQFDCRPGIRLLIGVWLVALTVACEDAVEPLHDGSELPLSAASIGGGEFGALSSGEESDCLKLAECGVVNGKCVCTIESVTVTAEKQEEEDPEPDEKDPEWCTENPEDPDCNECEDPHDPECGGGNGDGDGNGEDGDETGREEEYKAKLTCPASVTRGEQVACTFEVQGEVQYSISDWHFSGGGFSVSRSTARSSHTWGGTAVQGGTVTVTYVVEEDEPESIRSAFTVAPRQWDWQPEDTIFIEGESPYTHMLPPDHRLIHEEWQTNVYGWNCNLSECGTLPIEPHLEDDPHAGYESQPVHGGPNDGLWWVTSVAYTMHRGSDIHRDLTEEGAPFELTHPTDIEACKDHAEPTETEGGGSVIEMNMYEYNLKCREADIDGMAAGIWRHEGFGTGSKLNGHEAQAREALAERNIPRHLEGMVRKAEDEIHALVIDYVNDARLRIQSRGSNESYALGNWQGTVWEYSREEGRYLIKEAEF